MADIRKRTGSKGTTYQVRYPSRASKGGYAYRAFDTRKEAQAFLDSGLPKSRNRSRNGEVKSVPDAVQKWLDACKYVGRHGKDPVSPATVINYEYRAEIIKAYDWSKDIHELEGPDVVEFREWLLKTHSRDVAKKVLSSFHSVVLEMNSQGVMTSDPAVGIAIQKSRYDEPVSIPSIEEMQKILRTADKLAAHKNFWIREGWKRYRPMVYLAADTGMRPQEYLALLDNNLLERGVQISQALDASNRIGPPKTKAGRRYIPVSADTLKIVRCYQATRGGPQAGALLFPNESGGHQRYNNYLRRCWHKLMEHASMMDKKEGGGKQVFEPRYSPYSLRHFYASMMIHQNRDLKSIQERMGHADVKMTLEVYGHLIRQKHAEDREEEPGILELVF
jgi:integrase